MSKLPPSTDLTSHAAEPLASRCKQGVEPAEPYALGLCLVFQPLPCLFRPTATGTSHHVSSGNPGRREPPNGRCQLSVLPSSRCRPSASRARTVSGSAASPASNLRSPAPFPPPKLIPPQPLPLSRPPPLELARADMDRVRTPSLSCAAANLLQNSKHRSPLQIKLE